MTLEGIISRLTQYASWLYYRQWDRWEVVWILAAVVVVLLLTRAARRRFTARARYLGEHSPIVGIGLASHRRH